MADPLLQPFQLKHLTLKNRIMVSPIREASPRPSVELRIARGSDESEVFTGAFDFV